MIQGDWGNQIRESISFLKKGNFGEAFDYFDFQLEESPEKRDVWRAKGDVLWELNEYGFSLICYIIAEQLDLLDTYPKALLEKFRRTSSEITKDVVGELKKDPSVIEEIEMIEPNAMPNESKYLELLILLNKRLQQDPKNQEVLYSLGLANAYLKKYKDSIYYLDQLLGSQPKNEDALYRKLVVLVQLGDYEKARECGDKLVDINPDDASYWELLGDVYMRLRDNDEAMACYERSYHIDRTHISSLFKKGVLLGRSGRLTDAFRIYGVVARFKNTGIIEGFEEPVGPSDLAKTATKEPSGRKTEFRPEITITTEEQVSLEDAKKEDRSGVEIRIIGKDDVEEERAYPRDSFSTPYPPPLSSFTLPDIEYVRQYLEILQEKGGGATYLYITPTRMFEMSVLILVELLSHYHMNGVFVTVEKPSRIYRKILETRLTDYTPQMPIFVDCIKTLASGSGEEDPDILTVKNLFDMEELKETVELGLHRASSKYSGERYFVMCDNIAAFQYYVSPRKIRGFFKSFGVNLEQLHIYGYFLVAEGQLNLQLTDMIRNLPQALIQKVRDRNKNGV